MTRETLLGLVFQNVQHELDSQDRKWGIQSHPFGNGATHWVGEEELAKLANDAAVRKGTLTWAGILYEEVAESFAAKDMQLFRDEMIQVAAVAIQTVLDLDIKRVGRDQVIGA